MRSLIGTALERISSMRNAARPAYTDSTASLIGLERHNGADPRRQMEAYGSVGTLHAIVNRTSTSVAKVRWDLWRKSPTGDVEDRQQILTHQALNLWNEPNRFMTGNWFREASQQHMDLVGEWAWVLVGDKARGGASFGSLGPLEMWPVRPDRIFPVPDPEIFIKGYVYAGPRGERVPLEPWEVVHTKMPNPLDPYRGLGPVQSILVELDSSRYSAEWNRRFFENSAEPGGIVEYEGELSPDQFDDFMSKWRTQHKGVKAAHRVALLELGMKWVDRKYTMREMQFAELKRVAREDIREAFGIPKFALGDVDDVNRATADASRAVFAELLTVPRLERMKEALNFQLLPAFFGGKRRAVDIEFDYVNPIPRDVDGENADLNAKATAAATLIGIGFDRKDTLEKVGLPDIALATPEADPNGVAPVEEVDPDAPLGPLDRANVVQKLYLGVDTVLHWDEARAELVRAGIDIDPNREPPEKPGPQPFGGAAPGDGDGDSGAPVDKVPPVDARKPMARTGAIWNYARRPRGPLNAAETASEVDLQQVQDDWLAALDALLHAWADITAAQRESLAEQIRLAIAGSDFRALGQLVAPTAAAESLLLNRLVGMADVAAYAVTLEARAQGVEVEPVPALESDLAALAGVTVALLTAGLAGAAGAEALRWLGYGRDGDEVATAVDAYLASLSNVFLTARLGHALTRAQNMSRIATILSGARARYYASEKLDKSTCKPCSKIDGQELPTQDAMILAYGGGPYLFCEGTYRCRGTVVAVWDVG